MTLIIGIHNTGTVSSAAALLDGRLAFGCAEERLSRNKHDKYFPHRSIDACLAHVGATPADVDVFAIGWNPAINLAGRYRAGQSEWPAQPGQRFASNPNHLLPRLGTGLLTATEQRFLATDGEEAARITYVTHHLAHCANAYYLSGYDEAAVFSCDGYGERATTVWAVARGGRIEVLRETAFPHSLGGFYSAITQHLGFRTDHDEWKTMGMAAYGDPAAYVDRLRRLVAVGDDGDFRLDLNHFAHFDFDAPRLLSAEGQALLGSGRDADDPFEQRHYDLAAAAQVVIEETLDRTLAWLRRETGMRRLCFAGGVAQNVLYNGRLARRGPFDEVFVPFAPDDSGNSIGAALWAYAMTGQSPALAFPASPYLGAAYDDVGIEQTLARYGLAAERPADIADAVAERLAAGQVVGWFQGRMEFGPRALGNRSIMGDPRDAAMKDRVNATVKYREAFRPFAPAVLEDAIGDYFDMPEGAAGCLYMERALPVRPDKTEAIPATVHADGTGRVQAVSKDLNPPFHDLIEAFARRTGVPVVLNTSFNLNGEPIVESPTDAIRTFYSSGLHAVALGGFLLTKE